MREDLPDFSRLPEDDAEKLHRFGIGAFGLLFLLLFLAVIYSIGEKLDGFSWRTLKNGMLTFGVILLSACVAVIALTGLIRGIKFLIPETVQYMTERRQLRKSQRQVRTAIDEKQRLSEERARMTSRLQATFLFEKESTRAANAQASREFREALQTSVMRSCEIAFSHIAQVVEQYESVVSEIETSDLPRAEKAELLNSLSEQLDVAATEERNKDAQKMMEAEIWKVRFRKARVMAKDKPQAAIRYLQEIQTEARSSRLKTKISSLIESLIDEADRTA